MNCPMIIERWSRWIRIDSNSVVVDDEADDDDEVAVKE